MPMPRSVECESVCPLKESYGTGKADGGNPVDCNMNEELSI